MHHCVRIAADVLIDRSPLFDDLRIEWRLFIPWITVAEEVPRGIDERVHRIGLASRQSVTIRAFSVYKLGDPGQRRLACACELSTLWQYNRQLVIRNRDHSTLFAVNDRNRRAPEPLSGNAPVSDSISNGAFAKTFLFGEGRHLGNRKP